MEIGISWTEKTASAEDCFIYGGVIDEFELHLEISNGCNILCGDERDSSNSFRGSIWCLYNFFNLEFSGVEVFNGHVFNGISNFEDVGDSNPGVGIVLQNENYKNI